MPHRIARILCFVAALAISGLPTGLVQCCAWATMIETRSVQTTLAEAMQTTFDGEHPCPMCLAVKKTSNKQREKEKQGIAPTDAKPVRADGVEVAFQLIPLPRRLIGVLHTEIENQSRPGFAQEILRPPAA